MTTELADQAIALAAAGRTTAAIAAELGCTYSTALRLSQGAQRTPARRLPPGPQLLELVAGGMRGAEIASTYGVSPASVSGALKRARAKAAKSVSISA